MNKKEMVRELSRRTHMTKAEASDALNAVLSIISEELSAGGKVQISGFGNFESCLRAAKVGRDPHTNTPVLIPPRFVPVFKPGKSLKSAVYHQTIDKVEV